MKNRTHLPLRLTATLLAMGLSGACLAQAPVADANMAPVYRLEQVDDGNMSCDRIFNEIRRLYAMTYDTEPRFWDDPLNKAAFIGGMVFAPAYYYVTYATVSRYLDAAKPIYVRGQLDHLRTLSAQKQCFVQ